MTRYDYSRDIPASGIPHALARDMTMAEQGEWHDTERRRSLVSRRTMLQGMGLGLGAGLAGPTFWRQTSAAAQSLAITNRHVAYGTDPTRTLDVAAQITGSPGSDKLFLDYGPTPALGQTVAAGLRVVGNTSIGHADQYYLHATLQNLAPGTSYRYRLRTSSGVTSPVSTVTSAPAPAYAGSFRFTAFGDEGTSSSATGVVSQVAALAPRFHLLAGDICYAESIGHGHLSDSFDPGKWDAYFTDIAPSAQGTPWMFGTGNHEMEAVYGGDGYGGLVKRIDVPGGGPARCPTVYSFRYGNVGIVSLDFNDVSFQVQANLGYSGGTQRTWADARLAQLRATAGIDFLVVLCHHPMYGTSSSKGSDGGARSAFASMFDRHEVDLVINGHQHGYERTDPIRSGVAGASAVPGATVYPASQGTTYITVGSGGATIDGFIAGTTAGTSTDNTPVHSYTWMADGSRHAETVTWSRRRYLAHGVLAVDVVPRTATRRATMTVRFLGSDGSTRDTVILAR